MITLTFGKLILFILLTIVSGIYFGNEIWRKFLHGEINIKGKH